MSDQISWHVQLAVKPGQLDNFRALTTEMLESTRQEVGVLNYERFVSADGNFVTCLRALYRFRHGSRTLTKVYEELQRPVYDNG